MKKLQDCVIAVIFLTICCGIAAIMGLIEARDNQRTMGGGKRRPFPPTKIFIYTTEWIRRMTKNITPAFRRRRDHLIHFEDGVHRLSPEMMVELEKAPHYTMDELEGITAPVKEPIIITD